MKISRDYLKYLVKEQMDRRWDLSEAGECDHEFFGILVGYLGEDAESARVFCDMARSSQGGDTLTDAIREFNLGMDAEFEIRQAYKKIYGDDGDEEYLTDPQVRSLGTRVEEHRKNKKMNLTQLLKKMILQEINISVNASMEEDTARGEADEEGGEVEGEPANYGSTATMGSISEESEEWEDEDSHDAPPAGGMKLRPRRLEVDEVIGDVIMDLERGPKQIAKDDVIALLQHIAHIHLGG